MQLGAGKLAYHYFYVIDPGKNHTTNVNTGMYVRLYNTDLR